MEFLKINCIRNCSLDVSVKAQDNGQRYRFELLIVSVCLAIAFLLIAFVTHFICVNIKKPDRHDMQMERQQSEEFLADA
ncbi:hypothetical protein L596_021027 [Steinernema carpocapsae]|uniref:Uncharacterized protein n=1 Tax=Steinernema carpocapsae TaxID=34508 RepID=A0A4U5MVA7_STECR|nr:hypothetical protein L596_021027 [Steinernema carpocapsae]